MQTQKRLTIEPNSELIVYGKVPNYVTHGLNGVCSNSKFAVNKCLMVAKCLVTVPYNHKVPVKVLNPSNDKIIISKGRTTAEFTTMSNDYSYVPITDTIPVIQNMQISKSSSIFEDSHDKDRLQTIQEEFQISSKLSEEQQQELTNLLNENFDLFVTKI